MITVALIDDHVLIRNALAELIATFDGFKVILQADNGEDFIEKIEKLPTPDIALIDINMPRMNGYETAQHLTKNHPEICILALSVEDDEEAIIRMLRCGSKGYLLKDTPTVEFQLALNELITKGYYHSDLVANTLMNSIKPKPESKQGPIPQIAYQAREFEFLQMACSELTYKEIADRMCLSPRTVDGYRENLFYKLQVRSRVGMVLFAIKNGVVEV